MGADLYGSFYFRDAYNDASVLWAYGLSWWSDVTPLLSRGSQLSSRGSEKLLALMDARLSVFMRAVGDRAGQTTLLKFWGKQNRSLRRLLSSSVRTGESIYCSL